MGAFYDEIPNETLIDWIKYVLRTPSAAPLGMAHFSQIRPLHAAR
jgi:hypothetical protein